MRRSAAHAMTCLSLILVASGCGAATQEPTRHSQAEPSAQETTTTPASGGESEAAVEASATPSTEGTAETEAETPTPASASTPTPNDGVQIRLAIMERRAAELERIATLIAASREAALSNNAVGACGENAALEELRILGTSGIEGSDSAIDVHNIIDAWCERVSSGRHARESTREQRDAIRRLESDLGRQESSARSRRRTLLETAETLRPLVSP